MDCKDLMIWDWVMCNHYQDMPFTKQFGVADFAKGDYEFCDPIPLTEEILVKNGFKKESQTIDGDYCKYTLPGFALNWCDTDGFWYQNGDITPNHVHTLQHLLRLCGIEKEIEL